jgi:hypothetical protein
MRPAPRLQVLGQAFAGEQPKHHRKDDATNFPAWQKFHHADWIPGELVNADNIPIGASYREKR